MTSPSFFFLKNKIQKYKHLNDVQLISRRLGATGWSKPSGNLRRHFGPSFVREAGTAPLR